MGLGTPPPDLDQHLNTNLQIDQNLNLCPDLDLELNQALELNQDKY